MQVTMNGEHTFCTSENLDKNLINSGGRGFYNEFGIESAIGFESSKPGESFHKIGVGLLKKDNDPYIFLKKYDFQPAKIETEFFSEKVIFTISSEEINGYAYKLCKSVILDNASFYIEYVLENTGTKAFSTSEYVHNFVSMNNEKIDSAYILKFPFRIEPSGFNESVNPMQKVSFIKNAVNWKSEVEEPFFFSPLNAEESDRCSWELVHENEKIGLRETCNGRVNKVNLWGTSHVVSPEVFHPIHLRPGEKDNWKRKFDFFEL